MSDVRSARDRALRLYDATAARTSAGVLAAYSTSFGLGTRLLGRRAQQDIRAVYALVRLADEVVDTYRGDDAGAELDELEEQTARALRTGYSTNLIVHAFARTARRVGITAAETRAVLRLDARGPHRARARPGQLRRVRVRVGRGGRPDVRARVPQRGPASRRARPRARRDAGGRSAGAGCGVPEDQLPARPRRRHRGAGPHLLPGDHAGAASTRRSWTRSSRRSPRTWPSPGRRCRPCRDGPATRWARRWRCTSACSTRSRRGRPESLLTGRVRLPTPVKLLVVGESVLAEARSGREVGA